MVFTFGEYELDTGRFELRHAGEACPIEPQVFDVLHYLIAHRDRVVTKIELLDNIWGDRFVSESALTSRIKAARKLLGDDGKTQRVIKTAHGRGYRFALPVIERTTATTAAATTTAAAEFEPAGPRAGISPLTDEAAHTGDGSGHRDAEEPAAAGWATMPSTRDPVVRSPPTAPGDEWWPLMGRGRQLESAAASFDDPARGGVLLVGAAGLGKTRLAEELLAKASNAGIPTARAAGHPEAQAIPLAAFAHLVPSDAVEPTGDTDLDRATLFHRARSALGGETRRMLFVDDVDQLDELSRALLGSLIAERAVFAVLTMRSRPEPLPTVEHLVKDGHIERAELEPLDADTVETLLHRALGGPIVASTTRQLVDASLGNPGIVRQLVESSITSGTLRCVHGVWELSGPLRTTPSLAALVASRLDGLADDLQHAVELLSVAGELGVHVLAELTSEDALEELEHRSVIRLRTDGRRLEAALAHPLYGEIVRGRMPTLRARRLKRELAQAITGLGARRRGDRIRVVAWQIDSGGTVEPSMLVETARLALIANDLDTAEKLLTRAIEAERSLPAVQLLAELAFRRGEASEVEALLSSIDLDPLTDQRRAQIIRRRATNFFFDTAEYRDAVRLIDGELERVGDPAARRSLEAHVSMLLANGGQVRLAIERASAALPEATGEVRLELLRTLGLALVHAAKPLAGLELAREGQRLYAELDDSPTLPGLSMLLFEEVVALAAAGRVNEARAAAERVKHEHPDARTSWIDTAIGRLELMAGRTAAARRVLTPVINHARAHEHGQVERWVLALHACTHILDGVPDRAVPELERVKTLEVGGRALYHPEIDRAHAWLAAALGDTDKARQMLLDSAADCDERGHSGMTSALLHDVVRLGSATLVVERLEEIAAASDGDLFAARASHTSGVVEEDPERIEQAVELFERGGCRVYAAEAAAALASVLARLGRSVDADAAARRADSLRHVGGVTIVTPALP